MYIYTFFLKVMQVFASFCKSVQNFATLPSLFFPFLVGTAFAFGWTPCIGPVLGSILTMAAVETSIAQVTDRFNLSNGEQPIALALEIIQVIEQLDDLASGPTVAPLVGRNDKLFA